MYVTDVPCSINAPNPYGFAAGSAAVAAAAASTFSICSLDSIAKQASVKDGGYRLMTQTFDFKQIPAWPGDASTASAIADPAATSRPST
jgi:uncharacterized protein YfaQ (DUF2300 family)